MPPQDTIVRWSAAKGVARIAECLPHDFASQIVDTVMDMFSIHSAAAASLYDLPAIAEGTWHGAALACAEIARRSLVDPDQLPILIKWISKALYFDLRKGSHSIGSGVRDAAAYVFWSLARTQDVASLQPHAVDLARQLVTVALFDREIHIRRAASAAFQEHVGRTVSLSGVSLSFAKQMVIGSNRACFLTGSTYLGKQTFMRSVAGEMHSSLPHRK